MTQPQDRARELAEKYREQCECHGFCTCSKAFLAGYAAGVEAAAKVAKDREAYYDEICDVDRAVGAAAVKRAIRALSGGGG